MEKSSSAKQLGKSKKNFIPDSDLVAAITEPGSEVQYKHLVAQFRKENERLQVLIAKKQVAHESEINKLRAEHAEEMAKVASKAFTVNFVSAKDDKP